MMSRIRESISQSASRSKKRTKHQSPKKKQTTKTRGKTRDKIRGKISKKTKGKSRKSQKEDEEVESDSPWDPTSRRRVNYYDLDLKKDYLKDKKFMKSFMEHKAKEVGKTELGKRQRRWSHLGPEPLTDYKLLPKGWNSGEPDLSPDDIQGQIDRCKERIEDNIFPHVFERRLEEFEKKKAEILELQSSEPEGLSMPTIHRIKSLEEILELLEEEGDEKYQIDNILGILEAYRSKSLEWTGLVTYWTHGKQLCQPRPFDWDEFEAINERHEGHEAFWVEGIEGPSLHINNARLEIVRKCLRPNLTDMYAYSIAFRRPARANEIRYWHSVELVYDTASALTQISNDDLSDIAGPIMYANDPPTQWPTLGTTAVAGLRRYTVDLVEMEVTVLTKRGHRMCPWMRTLVAVPRPEVTSHRDWIKTDGVAMRSLFYYATTPSEREELVIANAEESLLLPESVPAEDRPRLYTWEGLRPNRVEGLDLDEVYTDEEALWVDSPHFSSDPRPSRFTPEWANTQGGTIRLNEVREYERRNAA